MPMPFQVWRAALQPASFGGAGFKVEVGGKSGGRRIADHQYPKRDTPFAEDMGRKAHRWPITGYCIGPGYLADRDALIAVCDSEGPFTLVHPSLGEEQVHCETYTVSESREKGGFCTFEFVFTEAGQDPGTATTADTQGQATSAANASNTTAAAAGNAGLSGSGTSTAPTVGAIGSDYVASGQAAAGSTYPATVPSNAGSFDAPTATVG